MDDDHLFSIAAAKRTACLAPSRHRPVAIQMRRLKKYLPRPDRSTISLRLQFPSSGSLRPWPPTADILRGRGNELNRLTRLIVQFRRHAAEIRRLLAYLCQCIQQTLKASDPFIVRAHTQT